MAKKILPKKKAIKPVDHTEENDDVKVSVEKDTRLPDGSKNTKQIKGEIQEDVESADMLEKEEKEESLVTVGFSKGYTINLGNYESARINCWVSKKVKDDERLVLDTMAEISSLIDEQLEYELDELNNSDN